MRIFRHHSYFLTNKVVQQNDALMILVMDLDYPDILKNFIEYRLIVNYCIPDRKFSSIYICHSFNYVKIWQIKVFQ